ncbi:malonate decarboxylase subunit delta [Paenisporosarcina antarctica]|uniref:Malonate decarboxylase acyl carrier protein n=1 Tax=Paenisporosarcina antarctica TaxID=417367 RepID=A0A4P6ZV71_9BACL|nr:malonate decarboxylase subunit delta [Paenisporosarcina antarctica]QBP40167.1 malonate decarboxylase subunit delta [Paenisporosarcina antarctica]
MESMTFTFPATKKINSLAHVGVVGSGDLEIMMEPSGSSQTEVTIRTGITGYKDTWESVVQRFFSQHEVAVKVKINDFGATPGVVKLRLEQALEVISND